ncbi:GIY-YIG nuclease family protein [Streptomyces sp. NPDC023588]|uniref:GIY-YIG nuclease family protein n=1 Tax=Streptomyces sp. NPDC023588 TaxID=3154907 RepID=UPI0033F92529
MENPTGLVRRDHLEAYPTDAARLETEVTSRLATEPELEALGYKGRVVVMQIVRTIYRADGTPINKTLTIQGGSTSLVLQVDPTDEEDEAVHLEPSLPAVPEPRSETRRPVRTYLIGMENGPETKIGRTTNTVKSRMAQLQTSTHHQLTALLDVEGDYEAALHQKFAEYRLRGEWFDLTPLGDPATVVMEALAEMGLDIRPGQAKEQSAAT